MAIGYSQARQVCDRLCYMRAVRAVILFKKPGLDDLVHNGVEILDAAIIHANQFQITTWKLRKAIHF